MPTPNPTPEEIESVREIARLSSYADSESRISSLNDAQWAATRADITEWAKVKNKHTIIDGSGVKIDKDRNRLDITNRVRQRFGLSELDKYGTNLDSQSLIFTSCVIPTKPEW